MSEKIERKAYRILEREEVEKFIKLLSKRKFNYRNYVKSEEDWWDLTNFIMTASDRHSGKIYANFVAVVGTEKINANHANLDTRIKSIFFPKIQGTWFQGWPQGRRQSFTYKRNRITENIEDFVYTEHSRPHTHNYNARNTPLRKAFGITSIYSAKSSSYDGKFTGGTGIVDALDSVEAEMQFDLFVYPMIGAKSEHMNIIWEGFCSEINKTDLYVYHNGKLIEEQQTRIDDIIKSINRLQGDLERRQLVIDAARSNLLANMGIGEEE